jgi:hypothetical protein
VHPLAGETVEAARPDAGGQHQPVVAQLAPAGQHHIAVEYDIPEQSA